MKKNLAIVMLIWSLSLAQEKMSIAVLSLQGNGISSSEALVLTDELRSVLVQTGKYNVLERNNMESILNEQGFQMSGCTSTECAVEAGKLLGVQKMIAGSIGKLGALYNITIRIFDVETGRIEQTASKRHEGSIEQLLDVIKQTGYELSASKMETTKDLVLPDDQSPKDNLLNRMIHRKSKFSIKAGITSTTTTRQSGGMIGYLVGGAYSFQIFNNIVIQPELFYTTRNFEYLTADETMHFENIQITLMLSYSVIPLNNQYLFLMLFAGPSYNSIINATKKAYGDTYDLKNYDNMNVIENSEFSFIFGPGLGLRVGPALVSVEGRYELGLKNLFKDDSDWQVGKARVISAILGITF